MKRPKVTLAESMRRQAARIEAGTSSGKPSSWRRKVKRK